MSIPSQEHARPRLNPADLQPRDVLDCLALGLPLSAAPQALPTWQQTMTLALAFIENSMEQLVLIRIDDKGWNDSDVDVVLGVDLALAHIKRLRSDPPKVHGHFDEEWLKAAAAINLCLRAFSRSDSYYFRQLELVKQQFHVLADAVNFAQEEAGHAY